MTKNRCHRRQRRAPRRARAPVLRWASKASLNPITEIQNPVFPEVGSATTTHRRITSPRLTYWAKTLGKFTTAQLVVQAVGVASGILLVRTLDQSEYAYFTIAFAMNATMNVLADSGISIGLSSIGGRVWKDPNRFGQLINTALRMRRYLAIVAVLVVTPLLVWMLVSNGASRTYAALISLAIVLGLTFQLSAGVLSVVPRLHSQIARVQKLDLIAAISRLALLCVAYFILLNAAVAVVATVLSAGLQYLLLRRWVSDSINTAAPMNDDDQVEIRRIIKSQAPNAIFYCIQGQLTIWLIGIFGSTQNVAEIGALARLGIIFAVIGSVMTGIVLPGFARCQSPTQLRRRYFQIVAAFILFGAFLVLITAILPNAMLWILGKQYGHLTNEVVLIVLLNALMSISGAMLALNMTKGWVKYYWLNIPCLIVLQVFLIYSLDLSSTRTVILFGLLSLVPGILFSAVITWASLFRSVPAVSEA